MSDKSRDVKQLANELRLFGTDNAYEMAVQIDEDILGGKGREFRGRVEGESIVQGVSDEELRTIGLERIPKPIMQEKYIRSVMQSVVDDAGSKNKVEAIMDNKMVDIVNSMTEEERIVMGAFNDEVAERQYYGQREVPITGTEAYCFWSNSSESWFCRELWNKAKEGGTAKLDANEIVVEADPDFLNDHKFLMKELPLFKFSYEAGRDSAIDKREQIKDWAFRQLQSKEIREREVPEEWM